MKRNLKNERGVTIIELMVVVALIGVIAVLAAPNMAEMVARAHLKEATRSLQNTVNECRNEAISNGMNCRFTVTAVDSDPTGPPGTAVGSFQWDLCTAASTGGPCIPPPMGPLTPAIQSQVIWNAGTSNDIPNVSIAGPIPIWPYLEFTADGVLSNPSGDFANGIVTLTVVSKKSSQDATTLVNIDRGGNVRFAQPIPAMN